MGIRGLHSFMDKKGILQPYRLKNSKVIIDGNNICHQLLYNGNARHFGGDYTVIKTATEVLFKNLLKCNINPYVVFDGAHDADDKKIATIQKKCEQSIRENKEKVSKHLECFPVLVYESFTMVLKELKIPHVACEGEADNQIAILAKKWCCPVISCDSDMYIFDLPGGFVHFTDMKIDSNINGEIPTKLYLSSRFQEKTGVSSSLLPLAATLFGSDYAEIDEDVKTYFFERIGARSKFSHLSKNLHVVFDHLRNVRDIDAGISLLTSCIEQKLPIHKATDHKSKISTSIKMFTLQDTFETFSIDKYFDGKETSRHHKCLPDRIVGCMRTCVLSGLPADIIIGRVILKPTIEQYDLPPVQEICLPLRQLLYGLITKSSPPNEQCDRIVEIVREKRFMTKKFVKPATVIKGYDCVPTLQEVDNMDDRKRTTLLSAVFEFQPEKLSEFPEDSKLFVLTLNYFLKNGISDTSMKYLKSYVFCHILFLKKTENATMRAVYRKLSDPGHGHAVNVRLFHQYLQCFQECLNMAYTINVVLGTSLKQPDPEVVYDGPFMYHFFSKQLTEDQTDELITDSLRNETALYKLYTTFIENIVSV